MVIMQVSRKIIIVEAGYFFGPGSLLLSAIGY
jgi:hypothetical protein